MDELQAKLQAELDKFKAIEKGDEYAVLNYSFFYFYLSFPD